MALRATVNGLPLLRQIAGAAVASSSSPSASCVHLVAWAITAVPQHQQWLRLEVTAGRQQQQHAGFSSAPASGSSKDVPGHAGAAAAAEPAAASPSAPDSAVSTTGGPAPAVQDDDEWTEVVHSPGQVYYWNQKTGGDESMPGLVDGTVWVLLGTVHACDRGHAMHGGGQSRAQACTVTCYVPM